MPKKLANAKKGGGGTGWVKGVVMTVPCTPFVLRALFSVRVPFTINVPLTVLGSCLLMDCLFQIILMDYLFQIHIEGGGGYLVSMEQGYLLSYRIIEN